MEADAADLGLALSQKGMAEEEVATLVAHYKAMREKMASHQACTHPFTMDGEPPEVTPFRFDPYVWLVIKLPQEFRLYLGGAALYRAGLLDEAMGVWESILELPESERQFRSTWAAFMCGKALKGTDDARAIAYFEQTRRLAADGFQDSAGLACSSLGWQAQIERKSGELVTAINHYYEMLQTGNEADKAIAATSLDWVCGGALRPKDLDPELARDPVSLGVVSVYVMANQRNYVRGLGMRSNGVLWLKAVGQADIEPSQEIAGRLAWIAYAVGDFGRAEEWVESAGAQCPYGEWVRAKLLMRAGKMQEAAKVLSNLVAKWQIDRLPHKYLICEELGVLYLGLGEYENALQILMLGGCREDAAYVAERIMTIKDVEAFLREREGETLEQSKNRSWRGGPLTLSGLRYLYARRLAREGRLSDARQYYPEGMTEIWRSGKRVEMRKVLDVLADRLAKGRDTSLSKQERADHLYKAALVTRDWGMELYGTEFVPDMFAWHGLFDWRPPARVTPPNDTTEEAKRYRKHAPTPDKRFHYRYRAADLMWECAKLSPNNDPMTAEALYTGGMYIAKDDPKAADKFYKALVRRCRKLPIGQQTDEARWFPKEPEFH
ncbi:MAG: hypothetical protein GY851_32075 [bacterium]|nr:hypothetical protein [bacterium]